MNEWMEYFGKVYDGFVCFCEKIGMKGSDRIYRVLFRVT